MTREIFELCQQWQQEGKRTVQIVFGDPSDSNFEKIWCYDYNAGDGFHAEQASDFDTDLKLNKIARLEKELKTLKGE